jgi:hypothetical protein
VGGDLLSTKSTRSAAQSGVFDDVAAADAAAEANILDPFTRDEAAAVGFGGLELQTAALFGQQDSSSSDGEVIAEGSTAAAAAAGLLDAPEALRIIQVRGLL